MLILDVLKLMQK